jgi:hypothetical protein
MSRKSNPFNITKAVDLTDQEINDFWVEIGKEELQKLVKPHSPMPMIILGGKGSGKTHLMRYFSFPLQKIRHGDVLAGINEEKYLGVYLRCSGLNSRKFAGKGIGEEVWQVIFCYYIELWLSELFLNTISMVMDANPMLKVHERSLCQGASKLLPKQSDLDPESIKDIIAWIVERRREVDFAVNNLSLGGKIDFNIHLSSGDFIFGLPKIVAETIETLSNITFLYLIDEFENLTVEQQRYFNTLYREKEIPSSFKVGARLHGLRTKLTFSADEENKEGSEFDTVQIDGFFRGNSNYGEFVRNLCIKRLQLHGFTTTNINKQFASFDEKSFLEQIIKKYGAGSLRPHLDKLKRVLDRYDFRSVSSDIIARLSVSDDPLIERANILLFYRFWNDAKVSLSEAASRISEEAQKFRANPTYHGLHYSLLQKFKADVLDQLALDCGEKIYYSGFSELSDMSCGIPRNLLKMLKHIFQRSDFAAERPFDGGIISLDSQLSGVKDAADWFFEDAKLPGTLGKNVRDSISRLAQFLREIRYSNIPPECSLCAFTFNSTSIDIQTADCIDLAVKSSYLIKVGERKDKNEKRMDPIYQLNGLLAPKWDLPVYKRGELSLTDREVQSIFRNDLSEDFNITLKSRLDRYNAPFNIKSTTPLFNS